MFQPDKILALLLALACLVMLARLAVGPRHRARFDRAIQSSWQACRRAALRLPQLLRRRQARKTAEQVAQEAIARARQAGQDVERNGNVYTPKSFGKPRKPD